MRLYPGFALVKAQKNVFFGEKMSVFLKISRFCVFAGLRAER
jgi:hypothetical protein